MNSATIVRMPKNWNLWTLILIIEMVVNLTIVQMTKKTYNLFLKMIKKIKLKSSSLLVNITHSPLRELSGIWKQVIPNLFPRTLLKKPKLISLVTLENGTQTAQEYYY